MNDDIRWNVGAELTAMFDESQRRLEPTAIDVTEQQGKNALGAAASKRGNQEKHSGHSKSISRGTIEGNCTNKRPFFRSVGSIPASPARLADGAPNDMIRSFFFDVN
jgi:hypothetical protein